MFHAEHGYHAIHKAVIDNHAEEVMRLLSKRTELSARTDLGQTPLHIAVEHGHLKMLHVLLGHQADPNARDHQGRTPVHLAAARGQADILRDLLSVKASDVCAQDTGGLTPLHCAAEQNHVEAMQLLIAHAAPLDARTHTGLTPLHLAVEQRAREAVALLLSRDAHLNDGDHVSRTPLHVAARLGQLEIVTLLLEHGAQATVKDQAGRTPLHEAAAQGALAIADVLLDHGAKLTSKDLLGRTPYLLAGQNQQRDMMALLRERGQQQPASEVAAVTTPAPEAVPTAAAPRDPAAHALYQRLDQQSRMIEEMLGAIQDNLFILDQQLRFTYVNPHAARQLGLAAPACLGKNWQELKLRSEGMFPLTDLARAVFTANKPLQRTFPWPTVNGLRYVECLVSPIHRADGAVATVLCHARDITERKRAEAALANPASA